MANNVSLFRCAIYYFNNLLLLSNQGESSFLLVSTILRTILRIISHTFALYSLGISLMKLLKKIIIGDCKHLQDMSPKLYFQFLNGDISSYSPSTKQNKNQSQKLLLSALWSLLRKIKMGSLDLLFPFLNCKMFANSDDRAKIL